MKFIFKIFFFFLFSFQMKAQLLFYQDTYEGGVTSDGRSYESLDYLQADTINFQLHISAGSTIRKAFLISHRGFTFSNEIDDSLQINFNNHFISFDSSDIVSSLFNCNYSTASANNWIVAKDVTAFTQLSNNKLIVPCQSCLMSINPNRHFVYAGFLLVVMYENNILPLVNPVIFLNNNTDNTSLTYSFSGLNKINTANDVALSVYTNNPNKDSITFNLSSSFGNTYLGSIGINDFGTPDSIYHYAPGSFYYENNTAFQLKDDNPNNGFDTTDALSPLKNYVTNNTQTFTITTTQQVSSGCEDQIDAFILVYTTPCPARSNKDTVISYAPVCSGSGVQLIGNSIGNYTWTPSSSLNHNNISNPIATPDVTTNYIALIDSNGCKHTEQHIVNVYSTPVTNSVTTNPAICGGAKGTATIVATVGSPTSYTVNGMVQNSPIFSNLSAGSYTFSLSNTFGCSYTSPTAFSIRDTNYAETYFILNQLSNCAPAMVELNMQIQNTNAQVWYMNGDSSNLQNHTYTFADSGKYVITLIAWNNLRQCSDTTSQTIYVKYCPPPPPDSISIKAPNVFSPNGDNVNDTWQLIIFNRNYTISNYQCTIYDRWGLKVFTSTLPDEGWTGRTTSGTPCSADTYYYYIKITATNSKGTSKATDFMGFLELVR